MLNAAVNDLGSLGADHDRNTEGLSDALESVEAGVPSPTLDGRDGLVRQVAHLRDVSKAKPASLADQSYLRTKHRRSAMAQAATVQYAPAGGAKTESANVQGRDDRRWTQVTEAHLRDLYTTVETLKGQLALALGVLLGLGFDLSDFSDLLP